MARRRRRDKENDRRDAAELEELRPYLGLAREIRHEVNRVTADSGAPVESLVDAVARIPDQERLDLARSVFAQLTPDQQWTVVVDAFDDDELRAALAPEHAALAQRMAVEAGLRRQAAAARTAGRLDTTALEPGVVLSIGLFTAREVQACIARGRASDAAARVVTLRVEPPDPDHPDPDHPDPDRRDPADGGARTGVLRVLSDTFNPDGGYFVTASYDHETWAGERLDSHALVCLGAAADDHSAAIEPVLFPGARVDVQRLGDDAPVIGRLSLGWATLGPVDVFAG